MIYVFDGSFPGFLTAVFESFERRHFDVTPIRQEEFSGVLFEETLEIITDQEKAQRVQKGLKKTLKGTMTNDIFKVFLSEKPDAWKSCFNLIQKVFKGETEIFDNFGDADVITFDRTLTSVNRERHRMTAFIRFQKSDDSMFHCVIEPDFNVLPLIAEFFTKRYADQKWLIYDIRRKYGLLYDKQSVSEVYLTVTQQNSLSRPDDIIFIDPKEEQYQNLWKQYFKSTNIEARKNLKLHLQHVPRRYWKYLVEKQ